jgi:hypothetical protein
MALKFWSAPSLSSTSARSAALNGQATAPSAIDHWRSCCTKISLTAHVAGKCCGRARGAEKTLVGRVLLLEFDDVGLVVDADGAKFPQMVLATVTDAARQSGQRRLQAHCGWCAKVRSARHSRTCTLSFFARGRGLSSEGRERRTLWRSAAFLPEKSK